MRLDTVIRKEQNAMREVKSLYNSAPLGGMSSKELNERFIKIIAGMGKAPRYSLAYIRGARDVLIDKLYSEHLEFCYIMANGERVSVRTDSAIFYGKRGFTVQDITNQCQADDAPRSHYYIKTGKKFF